MGEVSWGLRKNRGVHVYGKARINALTRERAVAPCHCSHVARADSAVS